MSAVVNLTDLIKPTPRQESAFAAVRDHLFTLYGGAGGGGKSYFLRWVLLALLLKWAKQGLYGVRVGLFSLDYPTLNDRQLSKIRAEFPSWLGTFKEQAREYHLAPRFGGGVIAFRNLDDPSKYKSAEFAAIAVEELTENDRQTFEDLRWRRRWPGIERCPFIAATNPTGIGHGWVKKLWILKDFSDEPEALDPGEFVYIPAKATDNPHLTAQYLKELASLKDEGMRRALLEGDWDVFDGQVFREFRRDVHVVTPQQVPLQPHWRRFRMMDWGYNDPTTCIWAACMDDGRLLLYREYVERGRRPTEIAADVLQRTGEEAIDYTVIDSQVWQHNISGEIVGETLNAAGLQTIPADKGPGSRIMGKQRLHEWLAVYKGPDGRPTSRLLIYESCTALLREIPSLVYDKTHAEDVDDNSGATGHGDLYAALRYGLMSRPEPGAPPERREEPEDPEERVADREARWLERMNENEGKAPKRRGSW